jgi:hypothetical protein
MREQAVQMWLRVALEGTPLGEIAVRDPNSGQTRVNKQKLRKRLRSKLGLLPRHRVRKGDIVAERERTPLLSPENAMAMRELQDLRDKFDAYPLVQDQIDEYIEQVHDVDVLSKASEIFRLWRILQETKDVARRAALLFEWGRNGKVGTHGRWTKARAAEAVGVNPSALAPHLDWARERLRKLSA